MKAKGGRKPKLTAVEICAGGGGSALGLERAGFWHEALIDIDPHSCATLRSNRPYWNVIQADLRKLDFSYWKGIDLLSGGLPCPPFSIAGRQLGENDDRDMFPFMFKIAKALNPRAVLIENVRGLLTEKFAYFRERVNKNFRRLGFETYWGGFNAVNFGVPQNRYRAFIVALRKGETKPLQWPSMTEPVKTVGQTLKTLIASNGWVRANDWAQKANLPAPTIVGGSHKHGGPDLGPTRARKEWAQLGVDGLGLANEAPPTNFNGMPRLTIPMVSKLQSFPDNWIFSGTKTTAYRQVGNALPVNLAYTIAACVKRSLE